MANETKWTPGPWYVLADHVFTEDGERRVASCGGPGKAAENLANARLIAASPALYEALARFASAWDAALRDTADFIPTHEQMNELHDAYDAAGSALALARGEEPTP